MSDYIRNKYIPFVVKKVVKDYKKPLSKYSDEEFIEFCQELYDKIKQKEKELN